MDRRRAAGPPRARPHHRGRRCATRVDRARAGDPARLRRALPRARRRAQGRPRVHGRPVPRHPRCRRDLDFMGVSSYGGDARSSGVVRLTADLSLSIEGRDVIIVEDIIDTGRTITYLRRNLATRHPRSLALCVLLDKVGPPGGGGRRRLRRLRDPGRVRGGLRPRLRRATTGICRTSPSSIRAPLA